MLLWHLISCDFKCANGTPVLMATHQNRSEALEGIEGVVRRQIQACPGMFRLRSSINASLSPLTSQSETSTVLRWGAAPSGGWTGHSACCEGPKVAPQWAMRRLRRGTIPGIPVCREKVWIGAWLHLLFCCVMSLLGLWNLCFASPVLCDVSAAFALYGSLKRVPARGLSVCECFSVMFPQLFEEGDTAGSPQCRRSICFFNNSAADCISPLVRHKRRIRRESGSLRLSGQGVG